MVYFSVHMFSMLPMHNTCIHYFFTCILVACSGGWSCIEGGRRETRRDAKKKPGTKPDWERESWTSTCWSWSEQGTW